jgi:hypothetical protein
MQKTASTSGASIAGRHAYSSYIATLALLGLALVFANGCAAAGRHARGRADGIRVASTRGVAPAAPGAATASRRHIIKNGSLRLLSKSPRTDAHKVTAVAKALGGFVAHARHGDKRSVLTLRIPGDKFQLAMAQLRTIGELDRISVRGRDVTAQVVDLDIRLATALKVRKRYLELLAKAQTVAEAMPVQKELERVNLQIERLKGRLKVLRDQVALSTINVELKYPVRPGIVGWVFYGLYKGVKWLFIWD